MVLVMKNKQWILVSTNSSGSTNLVKWISFIKEIEDVHAMFNEENTHIGPVAANFDLESFRDRRGRVFYVTDMNPSTLAANNDAIVEPSVVVAWKLDGCQGYVRSPSCAFFR